MEESWNECAQQLQLNPNEASQDRGLRWLAHLVDGAGGGVAEGRGGEVGLGGRQLGGHRDCLLSSQGLQTALHVLILHPDM